MTSKMKYTTFNFINKKIIFLSTPLPFCKPSHIYLSILYFYFLTKMHNKSTPYLYQKSSNWELNMVLFLMLWCWCYSLKSFQITLSVLIMMLNLHFKSCKVFPNSTKKEHFLQHTAESWCKKVVKNILALKGTNV